MTTQTIEPKKTDPDDREVKYTPAGATEEMSLSVGFVKKFLTTPTKSGKQPSYADVVKFMMLCKARGLNPWEGDAYLTGFDNRDGTATFSLITAIQALLKRAEACQDYAGMESGIVLLKDGELIERRGTVILPDEKLIGGWAKCYRRGHVVEDYATVQLETYDTNYSRWAKDKTGMIAKVAMAAVLRRAFPTYLGGLYTNDEMEHLANSEQKPAPAIRKNEPIRLTNYIPSNQVPIANGGHTEGEWKLSAGPDLDVVRVVDDSYAKAAAAREERLAQEAKTQAEAEAKYPVEGAT